MVGLTNFRNPNVNISNPRTGESLVFAERNNRLLSWLTAPPWSDSRLAVPGAPVRAPHPRLAPVTRAMVLSIFMRSSPFRCVRPCVPRLWLREWVGACAAPDLLHDQVELDRSPDTVVPAD